MEGVFYKCKDSTIINVAGMIIGMAMVLLSAYLFFAGWVSGLDNVIILLSLILVGLMGTVYCGVSIYVIRRAYIRVDEERISAFCHNGFSLKCAMSEVAAVFYGGASLHIELKSGRKYNILYVENALQMGKYIQERVLQTRKITLDRGELKADISMLRKTRINEIIGVFVTLLVFVEGMLFTAKMTGWRDAQEFSSKEMLF